MTLKQQQNCQQLWIALLVRSKCRVVFDFRTSPSKFYARSRFQVSLFYLCMCDFALLAKRGRKNRQCHEAWQNPLLLKSSANPNFDFRRAQSTSTQRHSCLEIKNSHMHEDLVHWKPILALRDGRTSLSSNQLLFGSSCPGLETEYTH